VSIERYIYYRVHPDCAHRLPAAAIRLQAALRERLPELQARLLVRQGSGAGLDAPTWMETYAAPTRPGGVDDALLAEIETLAGIHLADAIVGERHIESFLPCA
jgi:hypothetical protein